MKFARAVWRILVAIKDGLVLVVLLAFFSAVALALSMRPVPGQVKDGALALTLDGPVVEERSRIEPTALLLGEGATRHQFLERDLVRAIEAAATDSRIRAVALDLDSFGGGSQVTLTRIGAALDKVRHAGKPVLAHAVLYEDGAYLLAAHASEVWVDGQGGVMLRGPGGTALFYHTLLDRLKVKAHVYKVGTYKSAVEPYIRDNFSPEAKQAMVSVYSALWRDWQDDVKHARPQAQVARVTADAPAWLAASGGDMAQASKAAGLIDRVGDRFAFGRRVAELVGTDPDAAKVTGADAFKAVKLGTYLADLGTNDAGKPIAVVTIAGEIVDGKAGPGIAGGERIAALIDHATASGTYSALMVRVDSPGGSAQAAERIRAAIARFKATGRPVVVSMGNLAASGGYWVSTPADRIFAEPATITGSIGIFAVIPSFEDTLTKFGVSSDGLQTTPLSGQPDVMGGINAPMSAVLQSQIEAGYRRFVGLVSASRHKSFADVDAIAQGRIWDGATARQLGLVDAFGDSDDALAWVAQRAGLDSWHPVWLGDKPDSLSSVLQQLAFDDSSSDDGDSHAASGDLAARIASAQTLWAGQLAGDLDRLLAGTGAQAYCLECAGFVVPTEQRRADGAKALGWLGILSRLVR